MIKDIIYLSKIFDMGWAVLGRQRAFCGPEYLGRTIGEYIVHSRSGLEDEPKLPSRTLGTR